MNRTLLRSIGVAAALFVSTAFLGHAAEPPAPEATLFPKLITALQNGDYDSWVADGNDQFKTMPKGKFDGAVAYLAPMLRVGYTATYLGELNQKGARVTLWKITFKEGGDDVLATLTMKDGKIAGFFLR